MKKILFCFFIFAGSVLSAQTNTHDENLSNKTILSKENEMTIWDVFQKRRSVREFKSDPIPKEDILKIIDAARMAPTSGNQQPWKFLIVTDKNKIIELKEACIKNSIEQITKNGTKVDDTKKSQIENVFNKYLSAPVYIVVLTDNNSIYSSYNHWDGPLAAGYLLLAARALGYGTVFITDAIPDNVTKEVLQIPDIYTRVCITPLGIPVEWPSTPKKKALEEFIINEKF